MNNTRLLTISKKNLLEIDQALKAADSLLEKTNRFYSTAELHEKIIGYLRVLHTSYAARPGRLQKGHALIYSVHDFQTVKGYVNLLATYAMINDLKKIVQEVHERDTINAVFDLAIARVEWLEKP